MPTWVPILTLRPEHRSQPEHTRVKERTMIGRNVRTGVDNTFVAPVSIGDDAWIAAGSVITEDVPPGSLAIARAKQVNKEGRGGKRDD
jgi:bifunctional UDP-N-acetylglucosamine pyrophosphorylase/glucosamine-1-phosphate N-acetyltransferase